MGAYGSKELHPKLSDTNDSNQHLESLEWWYCERCGHKHLKCYKECPSCNQRHGTKSGWNTFWRTLAIIQIPITVLFVAILIVAFSSDTPIEHEGESPNDHVQNKAENKDIPENVGIDIQADVSNTETSEIQVQNPETPQVQTFDQIWQSLKDEYCSMCDYIDYATLARNPDKYKGNYYYMMGQVIQVVEMDSGVFVRMNVTKGKYVWTDTIAAYIRTPEGADRILEDDIITIYGQCYGLYTYETVLGNEMSIPRIDAKYYDLITE